MTAGDVPAALERLVRRTPSEMCEAPLELSLLRGRLHGGNAIGAAGTQDFGELLPDYPAIQMLLGTLMPFSGENLRDRASIFQLAFTSEFERALDERYGTGHTTRLIDFRHAASFSAEPAHS
ncbi:hypothetical protein ABC347_14260 [Sphingomonas sp. 1P06PA]|uniref:hypothetical protein n=1 Tax=Sphingomonas sp. 1P06PA TaxID=554121 RepID=UPI0039A5FF5F